MRTLLIDPYLDSLGGGERYLLTIAEVLLSHQWGVDVVWDGSDLPQLAKQKFNLNLDALKLIPTAQFTNFFSRVFTTSRYDVVIAITDGSLPFLFGSRNFVHFQVPFRDVYRNNPVSQLKKTLINGYFVNSQFTQQVIDYEYHVTSQVIYPPVPVTDFVVKDKQPTILYVSRFSNLLQYKGHKELIQAFKMLYDRHHPDYRLVLAGSTQTGSTELLNQLRAESQNYPIEIITNPPFSQLQDLYAHATFFWSASGFNIDPRIHPEQCEHFGISLVEAMAAGCVCLAVNKGGHTEIIQSGQSGYLWQTLEELVDLTEQLIADQSHRGHLSFAATARAQEFSKEKFAHRFMNYLANK